MPPIVKNNKIEPKIIVLTTNSEEKSASRLGFPTHTYWNDYKENYKNHCFIRWGFGFDVPSKDIIFADSDDFDHVLNPVQSIKNNVDKPATLQKLSTIVPTPKIYLTETPKNQIVINRPHKHSGGEGFELRKGGFKVKPDFYATQYIKTNKEIRVFLAGNKTLTCSRVKTDGRLSDVCRSQYGYGLFRKTPERLNKMVLKAARKLNVHLGAFDILVKGKKYYFLEFNTACTLDNKKTIDFYRKNIPILIKKKFPKLFKKK